MMVMAVLFDERVDRAIQIIWFDRDPDKREEALALLRGAAWATGMLFIFSGAVIWEKAMSTRSWRCRWTRLLLLSVFIRV